MEEVKKALDAIEGVGATGSGELLDTYLAVRPHLEALINALQAQGGEPARVAAVIENLVAGADSIASTGTPAPEESQKSATV